MFVDDIFSDSEKYNKVLKADVIFCDRAGNDSTPSSQSKECRIFGNSYFSLNGYQQRWPPVNTLDVSPKLNLAYRPPFDGRHRAIPCICQREEAYTPSFTAKASKNGRLLIVDCINWIPIGPVGVSQRPGVASYIRKNNRADNELTAPIPGFYIVPADLSEPYATEMQGNIGNESCGVDFPYQSLVSRAVSPASEQPSHCSEQETFSEERQMSFTNFFRAYRAVNPPRGSVHDSAVPTYQYVVYGIIGVLVFSLALAATGHAIKRKLQYRAKMKTKASAPRSSEQNLAPEQVHDRGILEEPENTVNPASSPEECSWYQALWQKGLGALSINGWKESFSKALPADQRTLPDLNEAEKGYSLRKLRKRRGTKPEDRTDLPVRVMPPASALPLRMLDGEPSTSAVLENRHAHRDGQDQQGTEDGSSTVQRVISPKIVATRRSTHSSSV